MKTSRLLVSAIFILIAIGLAMVAVEVKMVYQSDPQEDLYPSHSSARSWRRATAFGTKVNPAQNAGILPADRITNSCARCIGPLQSCLRLGSLRKANEPDSVDRRCRRPRPDDVLGKALNPRKLSRA